MSYVPLILSFILFYFDISISMARGMESAAAIGQWWVNFVDSKKVSRPRLMNDDSGRWKNMQISEQDVVILIH